MERTAASRATTGRGRSTTSLSPALGAGRRVRRGGLAAVAVALPVAIGCVVGQLPTGVGGTSAALGAPAAAVAVQRRADGPPTVLVDGSTALGQLRADTLGLSFEKSLLATDRLDAGRGNLAQLLRTLSPTGHLRFGGNSLDEQTWWHTPGHSAPGYATTAVGPADLQRLAGLTRASGWSVALGVNLEHLDTAAVRDETATAVAALGPHLTGIACGNEPDLFPGYTYAGYRRSWEACADAVGNRAPLLGPNGGVQISKPFLDDESSRLRAATAHWYPLTACGDGRPTMAELLSPRVAADSADRFRANITASVQHGLPAWIDETNSVSCEGRDGVSNVYGAALWGMDHALLAAQLGASAVNFHGRLEVCGANYAPLCASDTADLAANRYRPSPLYYGMLLASRMGPGTFLPTGVSGAGNLRSYAVRSADGTVHVALIDKSAPGGPRQRVALRGLTGGSTGGSATAVTMSAPALDSPASRISISGARVDPAGRFALPAGVAVPAGRATSGNAAGYTVEVAPGTAVLVTIPAARTTPLPAPGDQVVGPDSGRCLTLAGSQPADGTRIELADCRGSWSQRWSLAGGALVNPFSGTCLAVDEDGDTRGGTANGAPVRAWPCSTAATQQWTRVGNGRLVNQASGRCLDTVRRGTAAGTGLQVWDCAGQANQQWYLRD